MIDYLYVNNDNTYFLKEDWDGSHWIHDLRSFAEYDENHNLMLEYYQLWISVWRNYQKSIYTYDTNNNLETRVTYNVDGSFNWKLNNMYTYTYDTNGRLASELDQSYYNNQWSNTWRNVYTYDEIGLPNKFIRQDWIMEDWIDIEVTTYSYNANNLLEYELFEKWNGVELGSQRQYFYEYYESNRIKSIIMQDWHLGWVNKLKEIFLYDENGNVVRRTGLEWINEGWVNTLTVSSLYDQNNFLIEQVYKMCGDGVNLSWADSIYYYFHTVVGIESLPKIGRSLSIYPNPSNNNITIELDDNHKSSAKITMILYNLNGQLTTQCQITEQQTVIDVSQLAPGIYFVKILSDNGVNVGKFVKN